MIKLLVFIYSMRNKFKNKLTTLISVFVVCIFTFVAFTTITYCGGTLFQAWYGNACTDTQLNFMGLSRDHVHFTPSSETVGAVFLLVLFVLICFIKLLRLWLKRFKNRVK